MKKILFTVGFSVCSVIAMAEEVQLEPGKVALVQRKDGNWISVKSSEIQQSLISKHPWMIGSVLMLLGTAAYQYWTSRDPDVAEMEKRLQDLKASLLNFSVPSHIIGGGAS